MSEAKIEVQIDDASGPQLRQYARDNLGVEFDQFTPVETMRAQVRNAIAPKTAFLIAAPDAPLPPKPKAKAEAEGAELPEMVTVIIAATEEPGGDEAVPVGVNGKAMLIPRGEPSKIPYRYYEVLENAKEWVYPQLKDGGLGQPRAVYSYPFQVIERHFAAAAA